MRQARDAGHEVGLHAWDHHGWQANAGRWSDAQLIEQIRRGVDTLSDILGAKIECSAAAGWRADERVIEAKQRFGFRYNSDCRGQSLFQPKLADGRLGAPQIPVDLPFDEVVGPNVAAKDFNSFILDRFTPEKLNVYTIHAEVEGILMANDFRQLLSDARPATFTFNPWATCCPTYRQFARPAAWPRHTRRPRRLAGSAKRMSKRWAFPLLLAFGAGLPAASGHPRPVDSRRNPLRPDQPEHAAERQLGVAAFHGRALFRKPVAGYWMIAIGQALFGQNLFGVRFASALSTA
jgi:hypothetical protein